ncbi:helix-turn-helix transcriptional regulator [Actinoplanes sp. NPDC024001]|uniref:helix-turn-helix domain-containing protein n=1 Tax=Actinoplanes sp. NPDC024001 TaxID=3154598 RepID=UPI0033D0A679
MAGAPHEEPVGVTLARMRRAKKLTGAVLAKRVGMSQPKISRIERGRGSADPEDILVIARALGADESLARALADRAAQAHDRMTDWRPTPESLAGRQQDVADWESAARTVRDFQPALLPGLLQTSEYARAAMRAFLRLESTAADGTADAALLAAVTARFRRQEVLADTARSFQFVITEAVLRSRICPPTEMLAQVDHLRKLSGLPHVRLGIIPEGAPVDLPPMHGFTLLDDTLVVIDVYNTGLTSRGRNDVELYRRVFDVFQSSATDEVGPMLDRYRTDYIDQLRAGS